ncbi:hypothetical protein TVAG_109550 [Trichomonas vaginalis G3]|uniref:Uncharacterized protein n=1 Tax=Trichomonas vaginalis (strain ATCC PRA-98 / G3) TaxID=412133 RepID=A2EAE4_TRIV3|nr:hypothetical protein TVAGG3_0924260 [Trichomonas vaginalis G3]EAY10371.1 hypothetical protein TVAG_109550 [Trichomonas vaginalis G3]KAI5485346.1 hypothetical protein TVAGG3_0924260 [Trichomonas vaginalis G3]|eukprot:XP_001322594.1 hypothetical protein [Trichomonas vaginalis G3]
MSIDTGANIPFCLFGAHVGKPSITASVIPKTSQINIYTELDQNGGYKCGTTCSYSNSLHFFTNVIPKHEGHAELDFTYTGKMDKISNSNCTVEFAGYAMASESGIKYSLPGHKPENVKCSAQLQANNKPLIFGIVAVAIIGIGAAIVLTVLISKSYIKTRDDEGYLIDKTDNNEEMELMKLGVNENPTPKKPINLSEIPRFVND